MTKTDILVVDDEEAMRELLQEVFSGDGFTVLCASCAEEALDILREKKIQIIFLDLKLPGMDGVELCKRIRNDMPTAITVAITGHSSIYDLIKCREAGFDDYLPKPFDIYAIAKVANDAFEKLNRWRGK